MTGRNRKPIIVVTCLTIFFVAPLLYLFYYQSQIKNPPLTIALEEVPPFMMEVDAEKDKNREWFTNQRLLGKVTFLSYAPEVCNESCAKQVQSLSTTVDAFIEQMQKSEYNEQNKLELQRAGFGSGDGIILKRTEYSKQDFNSFFSLIHKGEEVGVFVFDRLGRIVGFLPESIIATEESRRLISKLVFTNYMDDYLSRRTFFGVKKEYQKKE
jgi:hypothetical protein